MTLTLTEKLRRRMSAALVGDADALEALAHARPHDDVDGLTTLVDLQALHLAPLPQLGGRERFQHHPALVTLKGRLEHELLDWLDRTDPLAVRREGLLGGADDAVDAVRRLATANLVPPVYDWVADEAPYDQLVAFLAVEGGPDGGFDDLVAMAQVGLSGSAKLTLAANYWDEMGRGSAAEVHTTLHDRLAAALDLRAHMPSALPASALRRTALNGVLATNRALQPEMIGALGILELQAGPRCRRVLAGLERVGAPADARPFYEEHAVADPRHGKAWLDNAIVPLVDQHPEWRRRIVRGARWRCAVNDRLFADLFEQYRDADSRVAS